MVATVADTTAMVVAVVAVLWWYWWWWMTDERTLTIPARSFDPKRPFYDTYYYRLYCFTKTMKGVTVVCLLSVIYLVVVVFVVVVSVLQHVTSRCRKIES